MVRLLAVFLMWMPMVGFSQTRDVVPGDLSLTIEIEDMPTEPFQQEMILLTVNGTYKRHITLEKLEQPDLNGLNWMQLGEDHWFESVLDGKTVKNFRRRIALFPENSGSLEIGPFFHHLTLLDEENKWFEHSIQSEPMNLSVQPAPGSDGLWFPVRNLQIADSWSNAPDQLATGEGVLRIVRVSALGARPDMIPPMPELRSPSALIFAHPEKRLVDLTPRGPEAIAYWRWTIKPRNDVSTILEPIEFSYFDTLTRKHEKVVISAQRVAYLPGDAQTARNPTFEDATRLRPGLMTITGTAVFLGTLFAMMRGARRFSFAASRNWFLRMQLWRNLKLRAKEEDLDGMRRCAHALAPGHRLSTECAHLLAELDSQIYSRHPRPMDLQEFIAQFRQSVR